MKLAQQIKPCTRSRRNLRVQSRRVATSEQPRQVHLDGTQFRRLPRHSLRYQISPTCITPRPRGPVGFPPDARQNGAIATEVEVDC